MRQLYAINADIMNCIDMETGEVVDIEALNALQMERETKLENVGLYVKDLRAEAAAIDAEIKALTQRKKACDKLADGYAGWLTAVLAGEKFSTPRLAVSFKKSTVVAIAENAKLPKKFTKVKTEISPDKNAIKEALKFGVKINGCSLQENLNIQIK